MYRIPSPRSALLSGTPAGREPEAPEPQDSEVPGGGAYLCCVNVNHVKVHGDQRSEQEQQHGEAEPADTERRQ